MKTIRSQNLTFPGPICEESSKYAASLTLLNRYELNKQASDSDQANFIASSQNQDLLPAGSEITE